MQWRRDHVLQWKPNVFHSVFGGSVSRQYGHSDVLVPLALPNFVLRRWSGGGTVFDNLGDINFHDGLFDCGTICKLVWHTHRWKYVLYLGQHRFLNRSAREWFSVLAHCVTDAAHSVADKLAE